MSRSGRCAVADVTNVLFVGIGGQGVLKASDVLARAVFLFGLDVKKSEIHGMSQRGGGVTSTVRFGKKVYSPLAPAGAVDFLVAFDRAEGEKYAHELAPTGRSLFIDETLLRRLSDARPANIAVLGRLSKMLDIPAEIWEKAISEEIPGKYLAMNLGAFRAGAES
jgi:indolepyruvate ferredoxin oxidoreductase beta subunit